MARAATAGSVAGLRAPWAERMPLIPWANLRDNLAPEDLICQIFPL
jgi:hypothetical protein